MNHASRYIHKQFFRNSVVSNTLLFDRDQSVRYSSRNIFIRIISTEIISGPITIPITPHSFKPMNTPRRTVTGWILPRELVSLGRIRLSTVPTIKRPQRIRPILLKYSSCTIRIIEAGSQTIDEPIKGTKDMIAMRSPQKITPEMSHMKNPTAPREPWMTAIRNCPKMRVLVSFLICSIRISTFL